VNIKFAAAAASLALCQVWSARLPPPSGSPRIALNCAALTRLHNTGSTATWPITGLPVSDAAPIGLIGGLSIG
jgi:hypothetical protein